MPSPARARAARPSTRTRATTAMAPSAPSMNGGKRRYVRFPVESNTCAAVDLSAGPKPFVARLTALVYEESYGGCGMVVLKGVVFEPGDVIRIQVGRLAPMRAEVRWCMNVDQHVQRLGVMYLD